MGVNSSSYHGEDEECVSEGGGVIKRIPIEVNIYNNLPFHLYNLYKMHYSHICYNYLDEFKKKTKIEEILFIMHFTLFAILTGL